jgi:hypothetical protein
VHLSKIELKMKAAVLSGPAAVSALDPIVPYLWMGKIYFGLLYLEHLLPSDRRIKSKPILPREAIEELDIHHFYLQGTRGKFECPFGLPGSLLIFGTLEPDHIGLKFDFMDYQPTRVMAIRMGSVGMVCVFHDAGVIKGFHDSLRRGYYRKNPLHPIQFQEVVAEIAYKARLSNADPTFHLYESPEKITVIPSHPTPHIVFDEWSNEEFCQFLAFFTHQRFDDVYDAPSGGFRGFLHDESGKFRVMDRNDFAGCTKDFADFSSHP